MELPLRGFQNYLATLRLLTYFFDLFFLASNFFPNEGFLVLTFDFADIFFFCLVIIISSIDRTLFYYNIFMLSLFWSHTKCLSQKKRALLLDLLTQHKGFGPPKAHKA